MPKRSKKAILKDKANAVFSKFIRLRDSEEYLKNNPSAPSGSVACCTCGVVKNWKEMHAGHYIGGRNNTVLYNEQLCHAQCFHCNSKMPGCLGGNYGRYTVFMMKKYGLSVDDVEELQDRYFKVRKMKEHDYQNIINIYTNKINA